MNSQGQTEKKKSIPNSWGCTYPPDKVQELAESLIDWIEKQIINEEQFLFGDWAFANKVNPKHLTYVANKSQSFKDAYLLAKAYQEHMLCKGSLHKQLDSSFSKFMLVNNHDYTSSPDKDRDSELENDFSHFMKHIKQLRQNNGSEGAIPETDLSA
jgi:hypothetical protein